MVSVFLGPDWCKSWQLKWKTRNLFKEQRWIVTNIKLWAAWKCVGSRMMRKRKHTNFAIACSREITSSVQSLSHVQLFVTLWTAACQDSLSITNSWSLHKLMSIESVMPSNHLILYCLLLLLPSIFLSIRVFSNESVLHIRWPMYWSFSFSISLPMNIQDWFPLDGLVWSPCSPRNSQESSPTPQFKSINSSALSFLYSPTLTSIHDYWKNHSFN